MLAAEEDAEEDDGEEDDAEEEDTEEDDGEEEDAEEEDAEEPPEKPASSPVHSPPPKRSEFGLLYTVRYRWYRYASKASTR